MEVLKKEISDIKKIDFSDRVICDIVGEEDGPTVIAMSAIHGNEPTGIGAINRVMKKIKGNKKYFKGRFIGLIGNIEALQKKQRFIDEDMNRIWSTSILDKIRRTPLKEVQTAERREIKKLLEIIDPVIEEGDADHPVIFADIHTFSSESGLFVLCDREEANNELLIKLGAPMIFGIQSALQGTASKYFQDSGYLGFTFEAGQHFSSHSESNASAGLLCMLVAAGCIGATKIKEYPLYVDYLSKQTKRLPHKTELLYKHIIEPGDEFRMRPGFKNFDKIKKGDWLANDRHGKILAQNEGYLLMPLYQVQGDEGFFVIRECE